MKKLVSAVLLVLPVVFFANQTQAAVLSPGTINSCGELAVGGPSNVYTLGSNITNVSGTCFTVTADGVKINGAGHTVTAAGGNSSFAVNATHPGDGNNAYTNLTIQNITFTGFSGGGVNARGSDNNDYNSGNGGNVTVSTSTLGVISSNGGSGFNGGNGGTITISNSTTGNMSSNGGEGGDNGGSGNTITISNSQTGDVSSNGGFGSNGDGGSGGTISITNSTTGNTSSNGGEGDGYSSGSGGAISISNSTTGNVSTDGGTVSLGSGYNGGSAGSISISGTNLNLSNKTISVAGGQGNTANGGLNGSNGTLTITDSGTTVHDGINMSALSNLHIFQNGTSYVNLSNFNGGLWPLAPGSISSCGSLNTAGTYTLGSDITNVSGTCFKINVDGVIIDGAGYTVTAANGNSSFAVDATNPGDGNSAFTNLTIQNITFSGFGGGVDARGSDNISGNVAGGNGGNITITDSSHVGDINASGGSGQDSRGSGNGGNITITGNSITGAVTSQNGTGGEEGSPINGGTIIITDSSTGGNTVDASAYDLGIGGSITITNSNTGDVFSSGSTDGGGYISNGGQINIASSTVGNINAAGSGNAGAITISGSNIDLTGKTISATGGDDGCNGQCGGNGSNGTLTITDSGTTVHNGLNMSALSNLHIFQNGTSYVNLSNFNGGLWPLAPGSISSCGSLNTAGTYTLGSDITNVSGICFKVNVDGVTIDGAGYTITASDGNSSFAVDATNPGDGNSAFTDLALQNITFSGFSGGGVDARGSGAISCNVVAGNGGNITITDSSHLGAINASGGYGNDCQGSGNGGNITITGNSITGAVTSQSGFGGESGPFTSGGMIIITDSSTEGNTVDAGGCDNSTSGSITITNSNTGDVLSTGCQDTALANGGQINIASSTVGNINADGAVGGNAGAITISGSNLDLTNKTISAVALDSGGTNGTFTVNYSGTFTTTNTTLSALSSFTINAPESQTYSANNFHGGAFPHLPGTPLTSSSQCSSLYFPGTYQLANDLTGNCNLNYDGIILDGTNPSGGQFTINGNVTSSNGADSVLDGNGNFVSYTTKSPDITLSNIAVTENVTSGTGGYGGTSYVSGPPSGDAGGAGGSITIENDSNIGGNIVAGNAGAGGQGWNGYTVTYTGDYGGGYITISGTNLNLSNKTITTGHGYVDTGDGTGSANVGSNSPLTVTYSGALNRTNLQLSALSSLTINGPSDLPGSLGFFIGGYLFLSGDSISSAGQCNSLYLPGTYHLANDLTGDCNINNNGVILDGTNPEGGQFTIHGNVTSSNGSDEVDGWDGSALSCPTSGSNVSLQNIIVTGNVTSGNGGAGYYTCSGATGGLITILNSTIGGVVTGGAGGHDYGYWSYGNGSGQGGSVNITSSTVGGVLGGSAGDSEDYGTLGNGGNVTITDSILTGNISSGNGGNVPVQCGGYGNGGNGGLISISGTSLNLSGRIITAGNAGQGDTWSGNSNGTSGSLSLTFTDITTNVSTFLYNISKLIINNTSYGPWNGVFNPQIYYFSDQQDNGGRTGDWGDPKNWWFDASFETPADSLPLGFNNVIVNDGHITQDTSGSAAANTLVLNSSSTIAISVTLTQGGSFNGSSGNTTASSTAATNKVLAITIGGTIDDFYNEYYITHNDPIINLPNGSIDFFNIQSSYGDWNDTTTGAIDLTQYINDNYGEDNVSATSTGNVVTVTIQPTSSKFSTWFTQYTSLVNVQVVSGGGASSGQGVITSNGPITFNGSSTNAGTLGAANVTFNDSSSNNGNIGVSLPDTFEDGLTAYWKLDETSGTRYDSSGNGYNFIDHNGVGFTTGIIGNAAQSTSGSIYLATSKSIDFSGDFTLSYFGKMAANGYGKLFQGAGGVGFELGVTQTELGFGKSGVDNREHLTGLPEIDTSTWHHYAVTRVSGMIQFYRDGVAVGSSMADNRDFSSYYGLFSQPNGAGNAGAGAVDQMGIWNRALSPSEISQIYQNGIFGSANTTFTNDLSNDNGTTTGVVTRLFTSAVSTFRKFAGPDAEGNRNNWIVIAQGAAVDISNATYNLATNIFKAILDPITKLAGSFFWGSNSGGQVVPQITIATTTLAYTGDTTTKTLKWNPHVNWDTASTCIYSYSSDFSNPITTTCSSNDTSLPRPTGGEHIVYLRGTDSHGDISETSLRFFYDNTSPVFTSCGADLLDENRTYYLASDVTGTCTVTNSVGTTTLLGAKAGTTPTFKVIGGIQGNGHNISLSNITITDTITSLGANILIQNATTSSITANGTGNGGNAGAVTVATSTTGAITANGANGTANGGNGGTINITNSIGVNGTSTAITANGGSSTFCGYGGDAGYVTLRNSTYAEPSTLEGSDATTIIANGGHCSNPPSGISGHSHTPDVLGEHSSITEARAAAAAAVARALAAEAARLAALAAANSKASSASHQTDTSTLTPIFTVLPPVTKLNPIKLTPVPTFGDTTTKNSFSLGEGISNFLFAPISQTFTQTLGKELNKYLTQAGFSKEQDIVTIKNKPLLLPKATTTIPGLFTITTKSLPIKLVNQDFTTDNIVPVSTYLTSDKTTLQQKVTTTSNTQITITLKGGKTAIFNGKTLTFTNNSLTLTTPSTPGTYILTTSASPLPLVIEVSSNKAKTTSNTTTPTEAPKESWFTKLLNFFKL